MPPRIYLMGALVRLAQENMKVLVESGVIYLSVGYAVLLDSNAQEKVNEQVFILWLAVVIFHIRSHCWKTRYSF